MRSENYYFKENDYDNMLLSIVDYCGKNNFEIKKEIGSGCFGIAFELTDGTALKITKDPAEAYTALQVENKNLKNIANIYQVDVIGDYAFIKQDLIDTKSLKSSFLFAVEDKLRDVEQSLVVFNEKELSLYPEISFKDEEMKFIREISNGVNQIFNSGGFAYDLDHTNIGKNKNGDYVIFDQKDVHSDPEDYVHLVNKLLIKKEENISINKKRKKLKIN